MPISLGIVADDYGVNPYRNKGIAEGFKNGVITNAVMLVNGEDPVESVETAKQGNFLTRLGLHVNLTEGFPISPCSSVQTLLGADGRLLGKAGFFKKLEAGQINSSHIGTETLAQIQKFTQLTGFSPKLADGHHFVHLFPGVRESIAEVFQQHNICRTRIAEDSLYTQLYPVPQPMREDWIGVPFYQRVLAEAKQARAVYQSRSIESTHLFTGLCLMGTLSTPDRLSTIISSRFTSLHDANPATHESFTEIDVELMVHIGYRVPETHCEGKQDMFWHCWFSKSKDREQELATLLHPDIKTALKATGQLVDLTTL